MDLSKVEYEKVQLNSWKGGVPMTINSQQTSHGLTLRRRAEPVLLVRGVIWFVSKISKKIKKWLKINTKKT